MREEKSERGLYKVVRVVYYYGMTTTTSPIQSIELDFAYDEDDLAEALQRVSANVDVSYKIVTLEGPGGGWPVIRWYGTRNWLIELLRGSYGMDEDEIAEIIVD